MYVYINDHRTICFSETIPNPFEGIRHLQYYEDINCDDAQFYIGELKKIVDAENQLIK